MGYTHRWENTVGFTEAQWQRLCNYVEVMLAHLPMFSESSGGYYSDKLLQVNDGNGYPAIVDANHIRLNGAGQLEHHDVFKFERQSVASAKCTTCRKPYDIVVQAVLLVAKHIQPKLQIYSDGGMTDWQPAADWLRDLFKLHTDLTFLADTLDPDDAELNRYVKY